MFYLSISVVSFLERCAEGCENERSKGMIWFVIADYIKEEQT